MGITIGTWGLPYVNKTASGTVTVATNTLLAARDRVFCLTCGDTAPTGVNLRIPNAPNENPYLLTTALASSSSYEMRGATWHAQTVRIPYNMTFRYLRTKMGKTGSPTGTVTCAVRAVDGSGWPTGSDLATATVSESSLSTTSYPVFDFGVSGYTVSRNDNIAFVFYSSSNDASNYVSVFDSFTTYPYGDGKACRSTNSGSTWGNNYFDDMSISLSDHVGELVIPLTKDAESVNSGNAVATIWSAEARNGVTNAGTTASLEVTVSGTIALVAFGLRAASVDRLSAFMSGNNTTGTSASPSTGTVSIVPGDVLGLACLAVEGPSGDTAGTWTSGTGYIDANTARDGTTGSGATSNMTGHFAYEVFTAGATIQGAKTGITSRDWAGCVAVYRGAATNRQYMSLLGARGVLL